MEKFSHLQAMYANILASIEKDRAENRGPRRVERSLGLVKGSNAVLGVDTVSEEPGRKELHLLGLGDLPHGKHLAKILQTAPVAPAHACQTLDTASVVLRESVKSGAPRLGQDLSVFVDEPLRVPVALRLAQQSEQLFDEHPFARFVRECTASDPRVASTDSPCETTYRGSSTSTRVNSEFSENSPTEIPVSVNSVRINSESPAKAQIQSGCSEGEISEPSSPVDSVFKQPSAETVINMNKDENPDLALLEKELKFGPVKALGGQKREVGCKTYEVISVTPVCDASQSHVATFLNASVPVDPQRKLMVHEVVLAAVETPKELVAPNSDTILNRVSGTFEQTAEKEVVQALLKQQRAKTMDLARTAAEVNSEKEAIPEGLAQAGQIVAEPEPVEGDGEVQVVRVRDAPGRTMKVVVVSRDTVSWRRDHAVLGSPDLRLFMDFPEWSVSLADSKVAVAEASLVRLTPTAKQTHAQFLGKLAPLFTVVTEKNCTGTLAEQARDTQQLTKVLQKLDKTAKNALQWADWLATDQQLRKELWALKAILAAEREQQQQLPEGDEFSHPRRFLRDAHVEQATNQITALETMLEQHNRPEQKASKPHASEVSLLLALGRDQHCLPSGAAACSSLQELFGRLKQLLGGGHVNLQNWHSVGAANGEMTQRKLSATGLQRELDLGLNNASRRDHLLCWVTVQRYEKLLEKLSGLAQTVATKKRAVETAETTAAGATGEAVAAAREAVAVAKTALTTAENNLARGKLTLESERESGALRLQTRELEAGLAAVSEALPKSVYAAPLGHKRLVLEKGHVKLSWVREEEGQTLPELARAHGNWRQCWYVASLEESLKWCSESLASRAVVAHLVRSSRAKTKVPSQLRTGLVVAQWSLVVRAAETADEKGYGHVHEKLETLVAMVRTPDEILRLRTVLSESEVAAAKSAEGPAAARLALSREAAAPANGAEAEAKRRAVEVEFAPAALEWLLSAQAASASPGQKLLGVLARCGARQLSSSADKQLRAGLPDEKQLGDSKHTLERWCAFQSERAKEAAAALVAANREERKGASGKGNQPKPRPDQKPQPPTQKDRPAGAGADQKPQPPRAGEQGRRGRGGKQQRHGGAEERSARKRGQATPAESRGNSQTKEQHARQQHGQQGGGTWAKKDKPENVTHAEWRLLRDHRLKQQGQSQNGGPQKQPHGGNAPGQKHVSFGHSQEADQPQGRNQGSDASRGGGRGGGRGGRGGRGRQRSRSHNQPRDRVQRLD